MFTILKDLFFGLPASQATFEARRFEPTDKKVQHHLEKIIEVFFEGYNKAMASSNLDELVADIENSYDNHFLGFAFEGSGMYYAMQDIMFPWGKNRLQHYMDNQGYNHRHILLVGAGFVYARLPLGFRLLGRRMKALNDPTLAWILPDGAGFHEGVFYHEKYIERCAPYPKYLPAYAQAPYDSGMGRSMWWVKGANPAKIKAAIDKFPIERQPFLWHGIGTACAYAGGCPIEAISDLNHLSGKYRYHFLSGLPLSTIMRREGKNPSAWTEKVCQILLNKSADEVSDMMWESRAASLENWDSNKSNLEDFVLDATDRLIAKLQKLTIKTPAK